MIIITNVGILDICGCYNWFFDSFSGNFDDWCGMSTGVRYETIRCDRTIHEWMEIEN
jgi:hypothetical protein